MVCLFFSLLSCFCQFLSFVLAVFAFLLVEIYVPVSKKKNVFYLCWLRLNGQLNAITQINIWE